MRVIITGAVHWTDADVIRRELEKLPMDSTVIHGDCEGVDAIAGALAKTLGLSVELMVKNGADYRRFGEVAWKGLNERMLEAGADLVLGFHANVEKSSGTKHMLQIAVVAGVSTRICDGTRTRDYK